MIDTLGFYVRITNEQYQRLTACSVLTQRIDQETGSIEFEYHNFHELMGRESWNYKVIFKLDDRHWVKDPATGCLNQVRGIPYVQIEFSAPKILWGHNVHSVGRQGAVDSCYHVRAAFQRLSGVFLPDLSEWFLYRIDVCANYQLSDKVQAQRYLDYLKKMDYPRKPRSFYQTGIYFSGRYSTLKVYMKGPEFRLHDGPRFLDEVERARLQKEADGVVRIEVECKRRIGYIVEQLSKDGIKLNTWKGAPALLEFLIHWNEVEEMERTIKKYLGGTTTKVMRNLDVYKVLTENLGSRKAKTRYSVYMLIISQGQNETKRVVAKRTYYDCLKDFRDLGISLISADSQEIAIREEIAMDERAFLLHHGFPQDFSLSLTGPYYQGLRAA